MFTFLLWAIAIFIIWMTYSDLRDWWANKKLQKSLAQDTSIEDYFAEVASRPDPWIGMDEHDLQNCNWTEHYTSCSEITTENGVKSCYYYDGIGYLHFTNEKLVSIVRIT